jgi:hypothetical protein
LKKLIISGSLFVAILISSTDSAIADADAIVGCWKMKELYGTYSFNIRAYESGRSVIEIMGDVGEWKWRRLEDGTYIFSSSGGDHSGGYDYWRIEGGELHVFDNQGLISSFRKVECD